MSTRTRSPRQVRRCAARRRRRRRPAVGWTLIASAPICRRLASSRFPTSIVRRSVSSSTVSSASAICSGVHATLESRRPDDHRLDRGERRPQVVRHGAQHRRSDRVDVGERAGLLRLGGERLVVDGQRRVGRRGPAGGVRRRATACRRTASACRTPVASVALGSTAGVDRRPRVAAVLSATGHGASLEPGAGRGRTWCGSVRRDAGWVPGRAARLRGRAHERFGLQAGASRLEGPLRGEVDERSDGDGDDDEHDQRDQVLAATDRERAVRRRRRTS